MKIDILTIFPEFFSSPLQSSMLKRAQDFDFVSVHTHDLRRFATDKHHTIDDAPYGGGGGMVFKAEPIVRAWEELDLTVGHCIYLTADGVSLTQDLAVELSLEDHLVLLCGHYKGVDERIRTSFIDREISIGDYVLTGGEAAAVVLIDTVTRLIPGVLGNFSSALEDSFHEVVLDCPWYTRPESFRGEHVPSALLSGNHAEVSRWRRQQALRRTFERRPDLLEKIELNAEDEHLILEWSKEKKVGENGY